jgi:hypothetical protein
MIFETSYVLAAPSPGPNSYTVSDYLCP